MIVCPIMGGLGNQLFQIFATMAFAWEENRSFGFIYTSYITGRTKRSTYWHTLLQNLKKYTYPSMTLENQQQTVTIKEKGFHYQELSRPSSPLKYSTALVKMIVLQGYFQSYKYFEKHWKKIYDLLEFDQKKREAAIKFQQYHMIPFKKTITLHFRVGDYKTLQDYHCLLPYEYYEKSILFLKKQITDENGKPPETILYFCEDQDIMDINPILERLKEKFPAFSFMKAPSHLQDWEQMLVMSMCSYNVIANSTFSWWAAYLNDSKNRIVCYPSTWFGPKNAHLITTDLFPPEWNKIDFLLST